MDITKWDTKNGRLNSNLRRYTDADRLVNQEIDQMTNVVEKVAFANKGKIDSLETFTSLMKETLAPNNGKLLCMQALRTYMQAKRPTVADRTYAAYMDMGRRLLRYFAATSIEPWDLNTVKVRDFEKFLAWHDMGVDVDYPDWLGGKRDGCPKVGPLAISTQIIYTANLKAFLAWAVKKDLTTNTAYMKIDRPRAVSNEAVALTLGEVRAIRDLDLSAYRRLQVSRDLFIFQALTGLRVSDLMALRGVDVDGDTLTYIQEKTAAKVVIPLHPMAMEIATKYGEIGQDKPLMPSKSDMQYRRDIKQICMLAGIQRTVLQVDKYTRKPVDVPVVEMVSTHTARRTFASLLVQAGVSVDLANMLIGHKLGGVSRHYISILDNIDVKREAVNRIKL